MKPVVGLTDGMFENKGGPHRQLWNHLTWWSLALVLLLGPQASPAASGKGPGWLS